MFGYGCAVFMQSDIVNFQRQGWQAKEILAGLAAVLPKNVFLYVASIPNLAALGSRFVLQGGTQNNLAVVKAEVDFIRSSFRAAGKQPEIIVHEHCGESGAIGAAVEALRLWRNGMRTTFIGLDAVRKIEYRTTRNEDTRCNFCKNTCLRTFIDIKTDMLMPLPVTPAKKKVTKVPLQANEQRLIIATCEKGTVEDVNDMKGIKAGLDQIKDANPNFVDIAAHEVFRPQNSKVGCRSDSGTRLDEIRERAHRADGSAPGAAHRHSARAERLRLRAALQRLFRKPRRAAGKHRLLRLHDARALPRGMQAAARSIRASRPRSASRTSTT